MGLFTGPKEVITLQKERDEFKTKAKIRKARIEILEAEVKKLNQSIDDTAFATKRERERTIQIHKDEIELLKRQVADAEELADEKASVTVRKAKLEAEDAVGDLERAEERYAADVDFILARHQEEMDAVQTEAELAARAKVAKEVDELKAEAAEETARAAAAASRAAEQEAVVKGLTAQLENYNKFVTTILTKVPNVDLSKFNIEVAVPPTEVTVVSGNQGGGKKNA